MKQSGARAIPKKIKVIAKQMRLKITAD